MAVGSSLLRTLLSPNVRSVEAMIMADKTNQKSLSRHHYEAGPAHVIAQMDIHGLVEKNSWIPKPIPGSSPGIGMTTERVLGICDCPLKKGRRAPAAGFTRHRYTLGQR
jgi:hypothetical protein